MRAPKVIARVPSKEAGLADLESLKVFEWQIDASNGGIFGNITKNIGQLKRIAKEFGVDFASRVSAAKNFDADESDCACDAPAVGAQVVMRLVTCRLDVRFHTKHNFHKEPAVDVVTSEDRHKGRASPHRESEQVFHRSRSSRFSLVERPESSAMSSTARQKS